MMRYSWQAAIVVLVVLTGSTLPGAEVTTQPTYPSEIGPHTSTPDLTSYKEVYYISASTGSDQNGDGTKAKPFATLQAAAQKKAGPDQKVALLVAAGTYAGATVEMQPYLDLFGGYDPASWQRDIVAHPSVIDGENARRCVIGADHSQIDGFVIRGGRSEGPGGAILCQRTSPTISNNTIVDNLAVEPADYVYGIFHQVGNDGGGIACITAAHAVITNNIIARNTTNIGNGGGIGVRNYSLPRIENNIICDNRTGVKDNDPDKKKRARSSNGAGISLSHAQSLYKRARIANNVISGNRNGGNSDAGGIYCEFDSSAEIMGNRILNNSAEDDGGGIYVMKSSEPVIADNIIAGNNGGGIRLSKEGRARIHNNIFFANGAVGSVDAWMLFVNNTTVDGGIGFTNVRYLHIKPSIVMNSICEVRASNEGSDPMRISHSDTAAGTPGEGNFSADPKFVEDGVRGGLKSLSYDAARVQTHLTSDAALAEPATLIGRVVRVGDQLGVIDSASAQELVVWGDLSPAQAAKEYEITPTYRLAEGSPCIGKGIEIPAELMKVTEPPLPAMFKQASPPNIGATPIVRAAGPK